MRKKMLAAMLVLIAVLGVSGCGSKTGQDGLVQNEPAKKQAAAGENRQVKIGLVMKTLTNPFFIEMEKGARKAERELGISLVVKTGAMETSIEQQIGIVEELIAMQADAIVIAPGSSTELVSVLKKAQENGIKIVNIDNRLDVSLSKQLGLVQVPFISVKNDDGAYLSAKYIADQIKTPVKAAILEGIREADNARQRKNGAEKAFAENPNITVVARETANWKIDEAYTAASAMFEKYPDIKAVFCANDMMAFGLIQYLKDSGRNGVLIAAFDNLEDARTALREGNLAITIDQQADVQGYTGVKYAVDLISGKAVPPETYIPVKAVTKQEL